MKKAPTQKPLVILFINILVILRSGLLYFSGGIVFYCVGICSSLLYVRVAYKWNELLHLYEDVDFIFCKSPYALSGWSLKTQIRFTIFMVIFFALCEHSLSWYSFLHDRYVQATICHWEIGSWVFYITSLHLSHIYRLFPVNTFSVLWAEYMNISFTFAWNYVDLFIMVMSLSIAMKFRMINERLEFFRGRVVTDTFWDEIRCHYNKICELNEYVDELIGNLICVACLGDLYSICLQLLNVATPLPYSANKIYFWYSTAFLICRTFAMFLTTASVNDESIKPLAVFRSIPSDGWFHQTQRLCSQIQLNSAALSGRNFFFLTRSIIISIAGTIITYELVLLQFDGEKILPGMFNPCGDRGNNSAGLNSTQY
ncbi:gustatory receptor for sugar taste 64a-like [Chironomus tepperi]|uniref:gustatory receptor for sugar taste 64a-like n=1 Tax=Chironomus tepperi TaxID=113505 RepID=UPI00391F8409